MQSIWNMPASLRLWMAARSRHRYGAMRTSTVTNQQMLRVANTLACTSRRLLQENKHESSSNDCITNQMTSPRPWQCCPKDSYPDTYFDASSFLRWNNIVQFFHQNVVHRERVPNAARSLQCYFPPLSWALPHHYPHRKDDAWSHRIQSFCPPC